MKVSDDTLEESDKAISNRVGQDFLNGLEETYRMVFRLKDEALASVFVGDLMELRDIESQKERLGWLNNIYNDLRTHPEEWAEEENYSEEEIIKALETDTTDEFIKALETDTTDEFKSNYSKSSMSDEDKRRLYDILHFYHVNSNLTGMSPLLNAMSDMQIVSAK